MKVKKVVIFTDGASLGNPGQAAIGAILKDEEGRLISRLSRRIGQATNNQAEYRAVIAALERAISLGVNRVEMLSDSELVVKQINGKYRVKKATLKPLYQKVKQLQSQLQGFSINHVTREQNIEADELANIALS
jgi:ribonuclease HI